jgi:hypothetical protein
MQFDWWGAIALGSNPALVGSLARGAAPQANPLTSTNVASDWSRHALVPERLSWNPS